MSRSDQHAKKIVVLAGSPRRQSTSHAMARVLADEATAAGATVDFYEIARLKIDYCQGCDYCRSHDGVCRLKDDMAEILAKIEAADIVVLASPLYFRSFSAQLKTSIDRFYCKHHARTLVGKDCVLLLSSGNNSAEATAPSLTIYQDLVSLLRWQDRGVIWTGGNRSGDFILDAHADALQKARELAHKLCCGTGSSDQVVEC